jgi:hypothetical protein
MASQAGLDAFGDGVRRRRGGAGPYGMGNKGNNKQKKISHGMSGFTHKAYSGYPVFGEFCILHDAANWHPIRACSGHARTKCGTLNQARAAGNFPVGFAGTKPVAGHPLIMG